LKLGKSGAQGRW